MGLMVCTGCRAFFLFKHPTIHKYYKHTLNTASCLTEADWLLKVQHGSHHASAAVKRAATSDVRIVTRVSL